MCPKKKYIPECKSTKPGPYFFLKLKYVLWRKIQMETIRFCRSQNIGYNDRWKDKCCGNFISFLRERATYSHEMVCADILKIIPDRNLRKLSMILKNNWPEHIHASGLIENSLKLRTKYPDQVNLQFYSLEDDWESGTFAAFSKVYKNQGFLFSMHNEFDKVRTILGQTKLIDWKDNTFDCINRNLLETIRTITNEKHREIKCIINGHIWHLSNEDALKIECSIPSDLYDKELDLSQSEVINNAWPHKYEGSEVYVGDLIKYNGGTGFFSRRTDELCAWILENEFNALGMLQTAENHSGKRYGSTLFKFICQKIAMNGHDTFGFVVDENIRAISMYRSMGLVPVVPIMWLKTI